MSPSTTSTTRVAIASFAAVPPEFRDDERLAAALRGRGVGVSHHSWEDETVDWAAFDVVVIRSTWNYSAHRERFVAWADEVGDRLQNAPAIVRWNSDKRYLADLREAGLPVVQTRYVGPGDAAPAIDSEVVIKPSVSAGGRDTGRFAAGSAAAGVELIERIVAGGRTAMVQPFLASVETLGETAVVIVDGELSHVLRKGAVLDADGVAPTRDDAIGAAEAMYRPDLVRADRADDDELALARHVVDELGRRFGAPPLYARVDMLREPGGGPVLLELEAVEPNLYLHQAPGSADRFAAAIVSRARG